jgi:hypothetical protein
MTVNDATVSYDIRLSTACSQFIVPSKKPVEIDVSGPSRYTYLKLDEEQTHNLNALAQKVGTKFERGTNRNMFMVYSGTFRPGQANLADSSCNATVEEKRVFGQIFEIAATSIAKQLGWSVNSADLTEIVLEKTVDFSFSEAHRACRLRVVLSQQAADRLGMDKHSKFR